MTAAAVASLSLAGTLLYTPEKAMTTMRTMARVVQQALFDPYVIRRANEIVAVAPPRDYDGQIHAIGQYVDLSLYFVDNPIGLQRVQPPALLLHDIQARGFTQGACDDAAALIAALGMAIGIPARFVAYAFGSGVDDPETVPFTHVITDLFNGVQWRMLDVTRPQEIFRLPHVARRLELDLSPGGS